MKLQAHPSGRRRRWVAGAGWVVGVLVNGTAVQAQTAVPIAFPLAHTSACTVAPTYPLAQTPAELEALLARIDGASPQCLLDAPFHAWRGAVLLSLRRPAAAIEALERSLLLDPNLPGAQLDYAQALLSVGDRVAARDLLLQLSHRQDLPAHLQALLKTELDASDPGAWRHRWVLTSALGIDTNLNNAPAASELTLTFPQGPVTLPLLESTRPQKDGAWMNVLQWQGLKPQGEQLWLYQAELRTRHTAQAATRYQQADFNASWLQNPEGARQWVARVGTSRVDFSGQHLLQSWRASAHHQWQVRGDGTGLVPSLCRPGLGLEAEQRRYPVTPELNGRYAGVMASANCQLGDRAAEADAARSPQLGLQARLGRDKPDADARPGGAYDKLEFRATWEGRQGPFKLSSDYTYTRQSDKTGYSVLLSNNVARNTSRHSLRLEIAKTLEISVLSGAEWFFSAEINLQISNLQAFRSKQNAIYTGLRWRLL